MENNQSTFDENFNLTTQKKFLSLLIYDPNWALLNGLDIIRPEYFDSNYLKNICKWIKQYASKFKNIPTKLVLRQKAEALVNEKQLSPKEYYQYQEILDEIFTLNNSDELEYFKEKAIEFARTATWKAALFDATNALKIHNYEEALNKFREVLNLGTEKDLGTDFEEQTTDQFLTLLNDKYDRANMIQTGIESWDKALGGGFARNNIHIIAACFLGKTKIKTNKGKLSFEELSKYTNYDDLEIYSFDGLNKIKTKIKNVFETKKVKKLIYLKFNNGKSLQCTPDHLFVIKNPIKNDPYIIYENGIAYKQAQYLGENDEF